MSKLSRIYGEDILSEEEVVEAFGCNPRWLADLRRSKMIASVPVGGKFFYPVKSLRDYLKSRAQTALSADNDQMALQPAKQSTGSGEAGPVTSLDMFK